MREHVWQRYVELLEESASSLLDLGPAVRAEMRRQVDDVLDATIAGLALPGLPGRADVLRNESESIGRNRAGMGVHPSQSLRAAGLVFDAALPPLVRWAEPYGVSDEQVALRLNRELLDRMSSAARGYVDHLLGRIHSSNQAERRNVSRYLHDVAAPSVALGLQNLELWEMYRGTDADRADDKIRAARRALHDALRTVRDASADLRVDVEQLGLTATVARQLETVPAGVKSALHVTGPVDRLPAAYSQEFFLIVREAIRNAVQHGEPASISVDLHADAELLSGRIVDDGAGFDPTSSAANSRGVGLVSMQERADLLAAQLHVTSEPGQGTEVSIRVPVVREPRRTPGRPDVAGGGL